MAIRKYRKLNVRTYEPKRKVKIGKEEAVPVLVDVGSRFSRIGGLMSFFVSSFLLSLKSFFKAKKKPLYQRKKQEHQEKILQVKKKIIQHKNPVPEEISILEVITVSELAKKMNLKASELISKLMSMGVMVTINQQIDSETAILLADEYNCKVNIVSLYDETVIKQEEIEQLRLSIQDRLKLSTQYVQYYQTSCRTGFGVEEFYNFFLTKIIDFLASRLRLQY